MLLKSKLVIVCWLACIVLLTPMFYSPVEAQKGKGKVVEAKAQKGQGEAKDENIKSKSDRNNPKAEIPAPTAKAEGKTRGPGPGYCGIMVDNWTPWIIQIYVDGNHRGLTPPWGNLTLLAGAGTTRVYARADFDDGTWLYWGPYDFNCARGETYTWKLGRGQY